jgi:peptide chain release factor
VNKTDSAVRATHLPSGLSVKVQTERSQHANKRLARALLAPRVRHFHPIFSIFEQRRSYKSIT